MLWCLCYLSWLIISFLIPTNDFHIQFCILFLTESLPNCISVHILPRFPLMNVMHVWMHAKPLSCVWLFVTPWTVVCQVPLSAGFSKQEYWSGLPCPPSGDLPKPGIKPRFPALQADSLPAEPPRKPMNIGVHSLSLPRGSSWPRNQTGVSCTVGGFFTSWATREAHTQWRPLTCQALASSQFISL